MNGPKLGHVPIKRGLFFVLDPFNDLASKSSPSLVMSQGSQLAQSSGKIFRSCRHNVALPYLVKQTGMAKERLLAGLLLLVSIQSSCYIQSPYRTGVLCLPILA